MDIRAAFMPSAPIKNISRYFGRWNFKKNRAHKVGSVNLLGLSSFGPWIKSTLQRRLYVPFASVWGRVYEPPARPYHRDCRSGKIAMRPVAAFLSLALAGCAIDLSSRNEPSVAQPVAPQTTSPPVSSAIPNPPSLSSPAARAAATPDASASSSGLLPCETQSCKINCSSKVPARARPKWCANFEAPTE